MDTATPAPATRPSLLRTVPPAPRRRPAPAPRGGRGPAMLHGFPCGDPRACRRCGACD